MPYTRNGLNLLATAGTYPNLANYTTAVFSTDAILPGYISDNLVAVGTNLFGTYINGAVTSFVKYDTIAKTLTTLFSGIVPVIKPVLSGGYLYFMNGTSLCRTDMVNGYTTVGTVPAGILSMADFNGKVYMGLSNNFVYMFDPTNSTITAVSTSLLAGISALCVYNAELYCGFNSGDGDLYKFTGGTTWISVGNSPIGQSLNCVNLVVFNNDLIIFTGYNYYISYYGYSNTALIYKYVLGGPFVALTSFSVGANQPMFNGVDIVNGEIIFEVSGIGTLSSLRYVNTSYLVSDPLNISINTTRWSGVCVSNSYYFISPPTNREVRKLVNFNGQLTFVDTTGNLKVGSLETYISASLGQQYLELGTGTNDFSIENFSLTLLTGWTKGTTTRVTMWDDTEKKLITSISRTFTNTTGADAVITEAGLYVYLVNPTGSILTTREKLTTPITVHANQTITFEYQLAIAYPQ